MEITTQHDFIPIILQIIFCVIFVFGTIFVSQLLGPKVSGKGKNQQFECGLQPIGNARYPFSVRYFVVAILFVLFDIEVVFMYPWAINFSSMGWEGLIKMLGFISLLFIGFLYIKKRKALDW